MTYNEAKDIFDKARFSHDITDINLDCLEIKELLKQSPLDIDRAKEKIRSINDKHRDNNYIHNFLFPPRGQYNSIDGANEQSLRSDLEWKLLYLKAKSQAKQFDEFIKDVEDFLTKKGGTN